MPHTISEKMKFPRPLPGLQIPKEILINHHAYDPRTEHAKARRTDR